MRTIPGGHRWAKDQNHGALSPTPEGAATSAKDIGYFETGEQHGGPYCLDCRRAFCEHGCDDAPPFGGLSIYALPCPAVIETRVIEQPPALGT